LLSHTISVIAQVDPLELSTIDPKKIMMARDAKKPYRDWLMDKEHKGQFTWTIALWATPAKAAIVGLSLKEYWEQIIKACYLDASDPVTEWRSLAQMQKKIKDTLNEMPIDKLHIVGEDVDLWITLGPERLWAGGGGRNIPSFELFTSPDWRGTTGWIRFNEPLYRYGHIIKDIYMEFHDGVVTTAKASQGNELLQQMLKTKNADKIGEFSLTDSRMSRITHPMAETLFDENIGGPFGNTHLAIGMAYKDCYKGDPSKVSKKEWEKMGYNDSAEHTDMVSTTNRTVTAHLTDGTQRVLYTDGTFTI
jgi:aminopeptidase